MPNVSFSQLDLAKLDLNATNFRNANLEGAYFWLNNLSQSDMEQAILRGAVLGMTNLSQANLYGANMNGTDIHIHERDLAGAKLNRAILTGADLSTADRTYSDMGGVNLTGATHADDQLSNVTTLAGAFMRAGSKHK